MCVCAKTCQACCGNPDIGLASTRHQFDVIASTWHQVDAMANKLAMATAGHQPGLKLMPWHQLAAVTVATT